MMDHLTSGTEENSLLLKVAAGDSVAFAEIVRQRWQKVLQHALTFVKSYQVAEELTQDVFIQLWEKREKLTDVKSFDNYLFIVSRNLIITHIRKKLVETSTLKEQKLEEMFFKPDEQFAFQELESIIQEGADLLSEPRRSVFLLSRIEGRDSDFISAELGIAKRTVRWHLAEALNFMRTHIHNQYISSILALLFIKV
ncbi:sigma-70 family RNA polymerase sigma factor [Flavobacterium ardleyense]|uniref:sigma-70 family RNA polymerase sigma factor n=1 Tax=Flavobacterium ardleyense TaxID=2038737 RepID=UPI00298BFF7C|nr:sigma-70 family RNA polymerase sigma factor [Flavobacterium ardleyense]